MRSSKSATIAITALSKPYVQCAGLLDSVPAAIIVVDENGRIVLLNRDAASMFGYEPARLLHQEFEILLPIRFRSEVTDLRRHADHPCRQPAGPFRTSNALSGLRSDGTEFPVEMFFNSTPSAQGVLTICVLVDCTGPKHEAAHLRAIVDAVPMAIVIIDRVGTIVMVNAETERLFGYPVVELLGNKVETLVPERLRSSHVRQRSNYCSAPSVRRMGAGRELFGLRKDGSEFPVEIGLSPVDTEQGPLMLSTMVDISERTRLANETLRQANERLCYSNEALERSNMELQRFAYIASHDLQSPMRSIASFTELLQRKSAEQLDATCTDLLARILGAVERLRTLVADLLEFSSLSARSRPFEPVRLQELMDEVVVLLSAVIEEAKAELTYSDLPTVNGDRSGLAQLMLNLVSNAIKYRSQHRPHILISAERTAGCWHIAVADNGIGIDAGHLDRIFDPFVRLHTRHEFPGTGIGLAVCRRVVEHHGGRIWVDSACGQGSVFHFTIPSTTDDLS